MSASDTRIVVVGSVNADLHLTVDQLPAAGATVLADRTRWLPGGKGANQAAAAARLRLGAAVSLVAAVGDDATADVALGGLAETGVDLAHVRRVPDTATGVAVVCVDAAGENLIVVSPGANAALGSADVVLGAGCAAVLVSLEIPTATAQAALSGARQAGALAVLNAAPAERVTPGLLAAADILVANDGETAVLAAEHGGDLAALARATGTTVVATAGATPCARSPPRATSTSYRPGPPTSSTRSAPATASRRRSPCRWSSTPSSSTPCASPPRRPGSRSAASAPARSPPAPRSTPSSPRRRRPDQNRSVYGTRVGYPPWS